MTGTAPPAKHTLTAGGTTFLMIVGWSEDTNLLDIRRPRASSELKMGEAMQELGRIFWTRQGLRLAYSVVVVPL